MNSTYFFTDFAKQAGEYARLKAQKTGDFIGLYGNASILAGAEVNAENTEIWQTLSHHQEVYVCPSAARRRGIDAVQGNPPRTGLRWLSLASMLERMAIKSGDARTIDVCLASDTDLARTEALELCLAALALDFNVQLSLRGPGVLGLQRSLGRVGAKGYASLGLFGLPHALISAAEIAESKLLPDALTLPWQLGVAAHVPLMFDF